MVNVAGEKVPKKVKGEVADIIVNLVSREVIQEFYTAEVLTRGKTIDIVTATAYVVNK